MKRVLVIDNYDSFTFNLVQYLGELGCDLTVRRNDQIDAPQIASMAPDRIVISPGPGRPSQAGVSLKAVEIAVQTSTPLLGVCLGHQAIAQAFGGQICHAPTLVHGKTSPIHHGQTSILAGISSPFEATRYHSLLVSRDHLPDCLRVTAWTSDELIMALEHSTLPIFGVQFHPESILTGCGKQLLENFLCCQNGRNS